MGTITQRRRANGEIGYTAQIRVKQHGKLIFSEAATFDRKQLATEWMRRREAELDAKRARGEPIGRGATIGKLIDWYLEEAQKITPWGRSKQADLLRLRKAAIAEKDSTRLSVSDVISHITERRQIDGVGPSTALNDLVWLRQVFRSARASLGVHAQLQAIDDAKAELMTTRVVAKSRKRQRRVSADEEALLLKFFSERDARARIPMTEIVRFAILTARRQEEICRLKWADIDRERGVAWLDDVKHPRHKTGNRRCFRLLSDAMQIIERQPRSSDCVFPYESKSVGAAFTKACKVLGLENLHFHDLRHEATSRLFERGYSIQEVSQFTLHESWATLQRYTHLKPEDVPER